MTQENGLKEKDGCRPSAPVDCSTLPGLTKDETRYFQWLLCKTLLQITDAQWRNLSMLNQKILVAMALQSKATIYDK